MQRKDSLTSQEDSREESQYVLARLKPFVEDSLNNLQRCDIHQMDNDNLILVAFQPPMIKIVLFSISSRKLTEINAFNDMETFKTQCAFISNRTVFVPLPKLIYFFKNAPITEEEHVYFFNSATKNFYPIKNCNTRPSCFRINYSVTLHDVKIYFFGGLMMNMEATNLLEAFDITTYTWEKIETKGTLPLPRHSHAAFMYKQYLYFLGGTASKDLLLDQQWHHNDLSCLNLETYQWMSARTDGSIPDGMPYINSCRFQEEELMLFFMEKRKEDYYLSTANFDLKTFEYKKVSFYKKAPDFKFYSNFYVDSVRKVAYQFGGVSFIQNSQSKDHVFPIERYAILDSVSAVEKPNPFSNEIIIENPKNSAMTAVSSLTTLNDPSIDNDDDSEELTFEELLEREKKLQAEEMNKVDGKKAKKKKNKKKAK